MCNEWGDVKTKLTILNEFEIRNVHKYLGYVVQRKVHVFVAIASHWQHDKSKSLRPYDTDSAKFYVTWDTLSAHSIFIYFIAKRVHKDVNKDAKKRFSFSECRYIKTVWGVSVWIMFAYFKSHFFSKHST